MRSRSDAVPVGQEHWRQPKFLLAEGFRTGRASAEVSKTTILSRYRPTLLMNNQIPASLVAGRWTL